MDKWKSGKAESCDCNWTALYGELKLDWTLELYVTLHWAIGNSFFYFFYCSSRTDDDCGKFNAAPRGGNGCLPRQMATALVDCHFGGLELVQLLAYGSLILWRQSCPWFVRTPIVIMGLRHLNVIIEAYDLLLLELLDGGPKAKLAQQIRFLLLLLFLLLGG